MRQPPQIRHNRPIRSLTFSPDGQHILTGSDDQTLRIWDMVGQEVGCISHLAPVQRVRFNADGTQVGSVSGSTLVRVWPWPSLLADGSAADAGLAGGELFCP